MATISSFSPPAPKRADRRARNRRGEGVQLREDILGAATSLLADLGDVHRLSLRAVAREVGVATTSIYLHFRDIEELARAVATHAFAELDLARKAASDGVSDPRSALLARCLAYCTFAIERPGLYRVMFSADLPETLTMPSEQAPGRGSFESLVESIASCQHPKDRTGDTVEVAALLWATLHGLVSLRSSRPNFPWPPIEAQVGRAVGLILGPQ